MSQFTPISALSGGLLIGLSALILFFGHGRIFGISGIIGGLLEKKNFTLWRVLIVLGLIGGALIGHLVFQTEAKIQTLPLPYLIVGGFLMGFGTRLGGGCTSGHGVCGNSRLSQRSIAATLTFMGSGVLTAFILNQLGILS